MITNHSYFNRNFIGISIASRYYVTGCVLSSNFITCYKNPLGIEKRLGIFISCHCLSSLPTFNTYLGSTQFIRPYSTIKSKTTLLTQSEEEEAIHNTSMDDLAKPSKDNVVKLDESTKSKTPLVPLVESIEEFMANKYMDPDSNKISRYTKSKTINTNSKLTPFHKLKISFNILDDDELSADDDNTKKVLDNKLLNFYGIIYNVVDDTLTMSYPQHFTALDIIKSSRSMLLDISSVTQKGYVNSYDVSKLPIFSEFIGLFTRDASYIHGTEVIDSLK